MKVFEKLCKNECTELSSLFDKIIDGDCEMCPINGKICEKLSEDMPFAFCIHKIQKWLESEVEE